MSLPTLSLPPEADTWPCLRLDSPTITLKKTELQESLPLGLSLEIMQNSPAAHRRSH